MEKHNHSNDPSSTQPTKSDGTFTFNNSNGSEPNDSEEGKELEAVVSNQSGTNPNEDDDIDLSELDGIEEFLDLSELEGIEEFLDFDEDEDDGVFSKFYTDEDALAEALPKMFTKEMVEEFTKGYDAGNIMAVRQTVGNTYVPVLAHIFMKKRFKQTKFAKISKEAFYERAKNALKDRDITQDNFYDVMKAAQYGGREVVVYRGIPTSGEYGAQDTAFEGYFTSQTNPKTGDEIGNKYPVSLLGNGCYSSVIYMSTQHSYARMYAEEIGKGVLITGLVNLNNAKVCYEKSPDDDYNDVNRMRNVLDRCSNAWEKSKENVKQSLLQYTDEYTAAKIMGNLDTVLKYGDIGFCATLCGYDALVCAEDNGQQLDILNPSIVDVKDEYEK